MRVTNLGPTTARNVKVHVVAVPFPGTEFVFPADWHPDEFGYSNYIKPVSIKDTFDSIPPSFPSSKFVTTSSVAQFKLESSQVGLGA